MAASQSLPLDFDLSLAASWQHDELERDPSRITGRLALLGMASYHRLL
jgi:hypothetical protein